MRILLSRRAFLRVTGAAGAVVLLPVGCQGPPAPAAVLSGRERRLFAALADAVIPPDEQPGGSALGAVEYLEQLLGALDGREPLVFAGGPYSGRQPFGDGLGGASSRFPDNDFAFFAPLDRVSEATWRLRLLGGDGPNGSVVGLRDQVRQILAEAERYLPAAPEERARAGVDPGHRTRSGSDGRRHPRVRHAGGDLPRRRGVRDVSAGPTVIGNLALDRFDALVIGSGAGGSVVACLLAEHGLKVLVLECGANRFDGLDDPVNLPVARFSNDELKLLSRGFLEWESLVDPRTFRASEADGERTYVGGVNSLPKTVGGGGVHADLKMPRFQPTDFRLGSLLGDVAGASFADWPVDYDLLEPFYLHCERLLGVQGLAGSDPFEGPRSAPLPMPPGVPMYVAQKIGAAAESLGYHPFPYPTAVNSQPYDGRPACVDCGFCSGYGCPSHAKGSPAVTALRRALVSGNCQLRSETRVVRLLANASGSEVTGVEAIGPGGEPVTFRADRYVLCASPIEDARIMLLSGGDLGNASGMVGRNLTFHFQTNAIGIYEERTHGHRGRTVTHGFSDFRGVPGDPDRPLGGIVEISGSEGPIFEASIYRQAMSQLRSFDGPRFKRLMRQSPFRDRIVALAMQAEDAPQLGNRVDLDPEVRDLDGLPVARITYRNHPFELSAREHYAPRLLALVRASGARWGGVLPIDEIPASAHVMGTLRFGADPATSVCDPDGRFHQIGNLWAGDGALFPTSSGYNPTMTLVALAARVAAGMVFPGAPERALG